MGQIFQKPESESDIEGTTPNNYLENDDELVCDKPISNFNQYNRIVSEPIDIPVPPINKHKIQTFRRNSQTRTI